MNPIPWTLSRTAIVWETPYFQSKKPILYSFSSQLLYIVLRKSMNPRQRVQWRVFLYTMSTLSKTNDSVDRSVWENGGLFNKTWSIASCVTLCRGIWAYWDFVMTSIKCKRVRRIFLNPIHFPWTLSSLTPVIYQKFKYYVTSCRKTKVACDVVNIYNK